MKKLFLVALVVGALSCGGGDGSESGGSGGGAAGGPSGGSGGSVGGAPSGGGAGGTLASGGTGGTLASGGTGSIPSPGAGATELVGYWLYSKLVENDALVWARSDVDFQYTPGEGRGLHKLGFATSGHAFYVFNTPTLSDFDHPGTFEVQNGMLVYHEIMKYSCAHPHPEDENSNALNPTTTYSYFSKNGPDELWLSVELWTGFNNTPFFKSKPAAAPPTTQGKWMVFERVAEADWYGKYMIRVCQGSPTCPCHPDCKSKDLLREPAPLPICSDTWPYS